MVDATDTLPISATTPGVRSGRFGRKVALFVVIIVAGLVLVGAGNYALDPFTYSRGAMTEMAAAFVSGRNYAVLDPNVDLRAIHREHVRLMRASPDIVIVGGSRWQEAAAALVPDRKLFDAFVHNDYYEDLLATTELLRRYDRMPKTLMLSIRFVSFQPNEVRESSQWKEYGPEYRAMARTLGLADPGWLATAPFEKWTDLLSVDGAKVKLQERIKAPTPPGPIDGLSDPSRDIYAADGSLHFSDEHNRHDTPEFARSNAQDTAAAERNRRLPVAPDKVEGLKKLIAYLKPRGVRVILAQTPFQPLYFDGIAHYPRGEDLRHVDAVVHQIGDELGVEVAGSLDAKAVGCGEDEFRDFNHPRPTCLRKLFQSIPNL
jgi:hypothetical protein